MCHLPKQKSYKANLSNYIRKSKSLWASNVVLARKRNGKFRLCLDYHCKDSFALSHVEEVFDTLYGATLFSKIDIKLGYHQVNVEESHK